MEHPILSSTLFDCYHLELTRKTNDDIESFQVDKLEAKGVLDYLQIQAVKDENMNHARTYLVYDKITSELAAFLMP